MSIAVSYSVKRIPLQPTAVPLPSLDWSRAAIAHISHFRPEGSSHHPQTSVRFIHDGKTIFGHYTVKDRWVRARRTQYGEDVWNDSCVEFFIEPAGASGYFNFEFNCGGAFLCNNIRDCTRTSSGFKDFRRLTAQEMAPVRVLTTMPRVTDPEIDSPVDWELWCGIPVSVLEKDAGRIDDLSGRVWRGNFYKCADESSHPHWGSWSPVDIRNFHLPRCFGEICFE